MFKQAWLLLASLSTQSSGAAVMLCHTKKVKDVTDHIWGSEPGYCTRYSDCKRNKNESFKKSAWLSRSVIVPSSSAASTPTFGATLVISGALAMFGVQVVPGTLAGMGSMVITRPLVSASITPMQRRDVFDVDLH